MRLQATGYMMLDDAQLTSPEVLFGTVLILGILIAVLVGYLYKKFQSKK